jgi:hypothetical protein
VAQVVTLTVGSFANTETFITTMNGKSITYTADGTGSATTVAAAIQALLDASTYPEFLEVTWTVDAAVITGTANTAGKPFTVSESGTGTYTLATPTASAGPDDASLGGNWSAGTTPAAAEDILVDAGPDLLYGLADVASAVYGSVRILASFEGRVGLPYRDEDGDYVQYRGRALLVGTAVPVTIGEGEGDGPSLVNLTIATAANVTVLKTGGRAVDDTPVVNIAGCSSGTVNVVGGDVGIAADDDVLTATVTTLYTSEGTTVVIGRGATVTTCNMRGGTLVNRGTITTLNHAAGEVVNYGTVGTVNADPADGAAVVFDHRAATTITAATFRGHPGAPPPLFERANDPRAFTVTNATFTGGAVFNDPDGTATWSNAFVWDVASQTASRMGTRFNLLKS